MRRIYVRVVNAVTMFWWGLKYDWSVRYDLILKMPAMLLNDTQNSKAIDLNRKQQNDLR